MSDPYLHCVCGHAERVHALGCLHDCGCWEFRRCDCDNGKGLDDG